MNHLSNQTSKIEFNLYQPHANQIKVHASKARYRVIVGGRRFGKSALVLNEALARAFQLRDQIIWIILPMFRQAKEIYWIDPDITKYFMPYVQAGLIRVDKSELSLHILSTNSYIRLKGSDNYDSLRGAGIDLIIWDEVADVKKEAFDTIKPALADSPNHRVLYIGTPKGLNWFHDFALKGDHNNLIPTYEKQVKRDPEWETWHFTSYDNLAWPEGSYEREMFVSYIDKEREEAVEKGTLSFFNQEYMASFEEGAGMYFSTWSHKTHVIPPFIPLPGSFIIGGMDWGYTAPFAFNLSVVEKVFNENKPFYRVKTFFEVYGTNKKPEEWSDTIKEKLKTYKLKLEDISWIQADPAMFNKGTDGAICIKDQFVSADPRWSRILKPAVNDRIPGWINMRTWMSKAPDGIPYWVITDTCTALASEIINATFDENNPEDLAGDFDHCLDQQRYQLRALKHIDAKTGKLLSKDEREAKQDQFFKDVKDAGKMITIDPDRFKR
jgi:Terminase large subunit, T4likevirus-type, N-terminal